MFLFILSDVLMVAVGMVLYLTVRALPRVAEDPSDRQGVLDRWAHSELPERIDATFEAFLVKLLRRLKVVILKLDNMLSRHLRTINGSGASDKPAVGFNDIMDANETEGDKV
jgi:hypothetical protein